MLRMQRTFENGIISFQCKKDCGAMRIHACAIAEPNPTNITLHFLNCLMDGQYTDNEVAIVSRNYVYIFNLHIVNEFTFCQCAANFSINWGNIQNCLASNSSMVLLDKFGDRTQEISSAHIPAISFNDHYDDDVSQKARENFLEAACSAFKYEVPAICSHINQTVIGNAIQWM